MSTCLVILDMQDKFMNSSTKCLCDRISNFAKTVKFDHVICTGLLHTKDFQNPCIIPAIQKLCEKTFVRSCISCITNDFISYIDTYEINEVYLVGIGDETITASTRSLFNNKIQFVVLSDLCGSRTNNDLHDNFMDLLKILYGSNHILQGTELIKEYSFNDKINSEKYNKLSIHELMNLPIDQFMDKCKNNYDPIVRRLVELTEEKKDLLRRLSRV